MSYASQAALSYDAEFRSRVITCCKEQAVVFKDDGRADIAALADSVLANPANANGVFELVVVAPNFREVTDASTVPDVEILSAVQAVWPTYAAVVYPPET